MIIALRSLSSGKVVSMWDAPHTLIANRDGIGIGEQFEVIVLDGSVPVPPTPQPPVPVPSGDAIDLGAAVVASADCPDVRHWPIVSTIVNVTMGAAVEDHGVTVDFIGKFTWPQVIPDGWSGGINYTLWTGCRINGIWYVLPIKECFHEYCTVGPILQPPQFTDNLTYYARPPLEDYQPEPHEPIVFFVTTGDTRRMNLQPGTVGRSNVIQVPFEDGTWA